MQVLYLVAKLLIVFTPILFTCFWNVDGNFQILRQLALDYVLSHFGSARYVNRNVNVNVENGPDERSCLSQVSYNAI